MTRLVRALWFTLAVACSSTPGRPDPKSLVHPSGSTGNDADGGIDVPPAECNAEFCGDTFLHEVSDPPNLYFLVDRSGSMAAFPPNSPRNKYDTARAVLEDLLKVIGHRVRYGAAIFPDTTDDQTCGSSHEIAPPALGGLPPCTGELDPTLDDFVSAFGHYVAGGGTPTAAAIANLAPELEALDGHTYLVLITDGAPNCNEDIACGPDQCTYNIEGVPLGKHACSGSYNCCDPDTVGPRAQENCVDGDATAAQVARLARHGIPTYVIGMPGAEPYADLLDSLATAGGTARKGSTAYYAVTDQAELTEALYSIGTGLAIRCSIDLEAPPDDPDRVNVYFDGTLVPSDPDDGWSWDSPTRIVVNGDACTALKSGSVIDARAVFGCTTEVR